MPRVRRLRPLPGRETVSLTVALIADVHHGSDSASIRGSAALPLFEQVLRELEADAPPVSLFATPAEVVLATSP